MMIGLVKGYTNLHVHADGCLYPCHVCKLYPHTYTTMCQCEPLYYVALFVIGVWDYLFNLMLIICVNQNNHIHDILLDISCLTCKPNLTRSNKS